MSNCRQERSYATISASHPSSTTLFQHVRVVTPSPKTPMLANDDALETQRKVARLGNLVRRYAWCCLRSTTISCDEPTYLLVIELPDGRRYWRVCCTAAHTPDELLLRWAECAPAEWFGYFEEAAMKKAEQGKDCAWNEYLDF